MRFKLIFIYLYHIQTFKSNVKQLEVQFFKALKIDICPRKNVAKITKKNRVHILANILAKLNCYIFSSRPKMFGDRLLYDRLCVCETLALLRY